MKLFLPQKVLEEWATTDKADLVDGKLVLREEASSHPVTPAIHFSKLVSGEDRKGLLGRVKTILQLADLGAEHLADSCIVGDTAYEVSEGYITEVTTGAAAPKGGDGKKKSGNPEADLLAAFILDKL